MAGTTAVGVSVIAFQPSDVASCAKPLPVWGVPGTNQERTFLACKPDAVQRGLVGAIIARFENRGRFKYYLA